MYHKFAGVSVKVSSFYPNLNFVDNSLSNFSRASDFSMNFCVVC